MQNKHRKNLRPFLNQDIDAKDVLSSHAYGSVARKSNAVPSRPILQPRRQAGRGYGDSMVGSLSQYRGTVPKQPKATEPKTSADSDAPVVGNRPQSDAGQDGKTGGNSAERRHHFIEPPKRGFNRFS